MAVDSKDTPEEARSFGPVFPSYYKYYRIINTSFQAYWEYFQKIFSTFVSDKKLDTL